eukprot:3975435-Amphidinium_carterae.1
MQVSASRALLKFTVTDFMCFEVGSKCSLCSTGARMCSAGGGWLIATEGVLVKPDAGSAVEGTTVAIPTSVTKTAVTALKSNQYSFETITQNI